MDLEGMNYHNDVRSLHDKCKKYLYYHCALTMTDGSVFDGIIENVDPDRITMLVGEDAMEEDDDYEYETDEQRQFGGHRRPRRRFRRFRRRFFPFAHVARFEATPFFFPRFFPFI